MSDLSHLKTSRIDSHPFNSHSFSSAPHPQPVLPVTLYLQPRDKKARVIVIKDPVGPRRVVLRQAEYGNV